MMNTMAEQTRIQDMLPVSSAASTDSPDTAWAPVIGIANAINATIAAISSTDLFIVVIRSLPPGRPGPKLT